MSDTDSENDKRDRLARDRLLALGRHDLVSPDGKSSWNGEQWEPIRLSLSYKVDSAEEIMKLRRSSQGVERFPFLRLPSKEQLRQPLPDPQQAEAWAQRMSELVRAKPVSNLPAFPVRRSAVGLVSTVINMHSGKIYTVSTVRMLLRQLTSGGELKTLTLGESRVYQGRWPFIARLLLRQNYLERDLLDGGGLAHGPTVALDELHRRVCRLVSLDDPDVWKMSIDLQRAMAKVDFPPFASRSRQAEQFRE